MWTFHLARKNHQTLTGAPIIDMSVLEFNGWMAYESIING